MNSWLEERLASLGIRATVEGPIEPTVACPCCGFFSLEARNALEICRVCLWEDTGDDPELHSGPNHMALREGRANFVQHGVCEPTLRAGTESDLFRRYRR
ncbi:MAG: CPCC family cysteine-rich protein [Myxococcales bacterium]|nr:CPCC family cysteine-rich protein [Myxococcales bacterium]